MDKLSFVSKVSNIIHLYLVHLPIVLEVQRSLMVFEEIWIEARSLVSSGLGHCFVLP